MSEEITQAEFARRMGFVASHASQSKKEGRLVMAPGGKLLLWPESRDRYLATADPAHAAVAAYHAEKRGQPTDLPPAPPPEEGAIDADDDVPMYDFQNAKAKREFWAAEREHAAFRKEAGELIEHTEHVAAMADVGAIVRARIESWPASVAPQLVGLDEVQIRATLAEQAEQLLRDMAARIRQSAKDFVEGAA